MKFRIRVVIVLIAAVVSGVAYWYWPRQRDQVLHLPGTVEIQEVRYGSRIAGRVANIQVMEGQIAEAGQELFTLEKFEWSAKREQARQKSLNAKAALDKANTGPLPEEIEEAKASMEMAKARFDRAKNGFREEQKRQAKADLDAAEADLVKSESDLARLASTKGGAISKSEMDAATAARDANRGRVRSLKAMVDMMLAGNRLEDIEEARSDYERASAHYQLLRR
ncbi:MAG: hypothetical protein U0798_16960, partial [Gemmataceae bacterium]